MTGSFRHTSPEAGGAGRGRPPLVTDAELVCLAVAQVLLRYHDEHPWLRAAASRVGHLFSRLLARSQYNQRLKRAARLLEAARGRYAVAGPPNPGTAEPLRLLDGTPVGCGQSKLTTRRSALFGWGRHRLRQLPLTLVLGRQTHAGHDRGQHRHLVRASQTPNSSPSGHKPARC
jgi:hypothetical protein